MGAGASKLKPPFDEFGKWNYTEARRLTKDFHERDYDFALDERKIRHLLGPGKKKKALAELVYQRFSKKGKPINALAWLASVALVATEGIEGSVTKDVALGLFDMFDFEKSQDMNLDELTIMLLSTAKAVYILLDKPMEPMEKLMEDLSRNAFGACDKNNDNRITRDEFVTWVSQRVGGNERPSLDEVFDAFQLFMGERRASLQQLLGPDAGVPVEGQEEVKAGCYQSEAPKAVLAEEQVADVKMPAQETPAAHMQEPTAEEIRAPLPVNDEGAVQVGVPVQSQQVEVIQQPPAHVEQHEEARHEEAHRPAEDVAKAETVSASEAVAAQDSAPVVEPVPQLSEAGFVVEPSPVEQLPEKEARQGVDESTTHAPPVSRPELESVPAIAVVPEDPMAVPESAFVEAPQEDQAVPFTPASTTVGLNAAATVETSAATDSLIASALEVAAKQVAAISEELSKPLAVAEEAALHVDEVTSQAARMVSELMENALEMAASGSSVIVEAVVVEQRREDIAAVEQPAELKVEPEEVVAPAAVEGVAEHTTQEPVQPSPETTQEDALRAEGLELPSFGVDAGTAQSTAAEDPAATGAESRFVMVEGRDSPVQSPGRPNKRDYQLVEYVSPAQPSAAPAPAAEGVPIPPLAPAKDDVHAHEVKKTVDPAPEKSKAPQAVEGNVTADVAAEFVADALEKAVEAVGGSAAGEPHVEKHATEAVPHVAAAPEAPRAEQTEIAVEKEAKHATPPEEVLAANTGAEEARDAPHQQQEQQEHPVAAEAEPREIKPEADVGEKKEADVLDAHKETLGRRESLKRKGSSSSQSGEHDAAALLERRPSFKADEVVRRSSEMGMHLEKPIADVSHAEGPASARRPSSAAASATDEKVASADEEAAPPSAVGVLEPPAIASTKQLGEIELRRQGSKQLILAGDEQAVEPKPPVRRTSTKKADQLGLAAPEAPVGEHVVPPEEGGAVKAEDPAVSSEEKHDAERPVEASVEEQPVRPRSASGDLPPADTVVGELTKDALSPAEAVPAEGAEVASDAAKAAPEAEAPAPTVVTEDQAAAEPVRRGSVKKQIAPSEQDVQPVESSPVETLAHTHEAVDRLENLTEHAAQAEMGTEAPQTNVTESAVVNEAQGHEHAASVPEAGEVGTGGAANAPADAQTEVPQTDTTESAAANEAQGHEHAASVKEAGEVGTAVAADAPAEEHTHAHEADTQAASSSELPKPEVHSETEPSHAAAVEPQAVETPAEARTQATEVVTSVQVSSEEGVMPAEQAVQEPKEEKESVEASAPGVEQHVVEAAETTEAAPVADIAVQEGTVTAVLQPEQPEVVLGGSPSVEAPAAPEHVESEPNKDATHTQEAEAVPGGSPFVEPPAPPEHIESEQKKDATDAAANDGPRDVESAKHATEEVPVDVGANDLSPKTELASAEPSSESASTVALASGEPNLAAPTEPETPTPQVEAETHVVSDEVVTESAPEAVAAEASEASHRGELLRAPSTKMEGDVGGQQLTTAAEEHAESHTHANEVEAPVEVEMAALKPEEPVKHEAEREAKPEVEGGAVAPVSVPETVQAVSAETTVPAHEASEVSHATEAHEESKPAELVQQGSMKEKRVDAAPSEESGAAEISKEMTTAAPTSEPEAPVTENAGSAVAETMTHATAEDEKAGEAPAAGDTTEIAATPEQEVTTELPVPASESPEALPHVERVHAEHREDAVLTAPTTEEPAGEVKMDLTELAPSEASLGEHTADARAVEPSAAPVADASAETPVAEAQVAEVASVKADVAPTADTPAEGPVEAPAVGESQVKSHEQETTEAAPAVDLARQATGKIDLGAPAAHAQHVLEESALKALETEGSTEPPVDATAPEMPAEEKKDGIVPPSAPARQGSVKAMGRTGSLKGAAELGVDSAPVTAHEALTTEAVSTHDEKPGADVVDGGEAKVAPPLSEVQGSARRSSRQLAPVEFVRQGSKNDHVSEPQTQETVAHVSHVAEEHAGPAKHEEQMAKPEEQTEVHSQKKTTEAAAPADDPPSQTEITETAAPIDNTERKGHGGPAEALMNAGATPTEEGTHVIEEVSESKNNETVAAETHTHGPHGQVRRGSTKGKVDLGAAIEATAATEAPAHAETQDTHATASARRASKDIAPAELVRRDSKKEDIITPVSESSEPKAPIRRASTKQAVELGVAATASDVTPSDPPVRRSSKDLRDGALDLPHSSHEGKAEGGAGGASSQSARRWSKEVAPAHADGPASARASTTHIDAATAEAKVAAVRRGSSSKAVLTAKASHDTSPSAPQVVHSLERRSSSKKTDIGDATGAGGTGSPRLGSSKYLRPIDPAKRSGSSKDVAVEGVVRQGSTKDVAAVEPSEPKAELRRASVKGEAHEGVVGTDGGELKADHVSAGVGKHEGAREAEGHGEEKKKHHEENEAHHHNNGPKTLTADARDEKPADPSAA